ncbi:MAG: sigma 54-interacting transcriptional regulator [Acidobacteriota bacterium]|nr:sigma 54-interacting transcriptional regulator [Acidobacteriota bacterium]
MPSTDYLTRHLQHLAEVTRAASVAVYAPVPWTNGTPLLAHFGEAAPVPELASGEAAEGFAARARSALVGTRGNEESHGTLMSEAGDGVLLQIPLLSDLWSGGTASGLDGSAGARRRRSDRIGAATVGWVGIRLGGEATPDRLATVRAAAPIARALASAIVGLHGALTDPLTGLPGRHELDILLGADLQHARRHGGPCGLVLVNPLGLEQVNARHGRRAGDAVLREVVQTLRVLVRRTDAVMRYGGAIFALPLGATTAAHTAIVAERVRASIAGRAFLDEAVRVPCAVGAVSCEASEAHATEPIDLLRRAAEALGNAREHDGKRIVVWRESDGLQASSSDRLLGIFTGRADKDYRNMGLLWDVLQVLSGTQGASELARLVVERLATLVRADRTGLFVTGDPAPRLLAGNQRKASDSGDILANEDVAEDERALVADAMSVGSPRERILQRADGCQRGVAVPLVTGERVMGAICLVGPPEALDLDKTDIWVLSGVGAQLAVALDRERLVEGHRVRDEQERRRLEAEVQDLRAALQQGHVVFQSPAMGLLLDRARRVAATETTVLITGESGTGKEMLAQTLHRLSRRRTKPFVIVDCGAIPATLIDSELFGHERGAFTGAHQRSPGRLAQANGGTLFLDEIGELPLDLQSRLLRFVQEKTISTVGGGAARKVDVRIIAATNRRLEAEVRAGRFREDLFYRLNVVRLHVPPLRERPEDVRLLAQHFARANAAEQRKVVLGFSAAAERRLVEHSWPGNVRELQNTVLQAVVLAEGEELQAEDLLLPDGNVHAAQPVPGTFADESVPDSSPPPPNPTNGGAAPDFDAAWANLRECLGGQVEEACAARPRLAIPLRRWLLTDLTLAVHAEAGQQRAEAAGRLGVPPTTFARHLRKAVSERAMAPPPPGWDSVRQAVEAMVSARNGPPSGLMRDVEALLLDIVVEHVPSHLSFAAALMDYSTPTMKRRLQARRAGTGYSLAQPRSSPDAIEIPIEP